MAKTARKKKVTKKSARKKAPRKHATKKRTTRKKKAPKKAAPKAKTGDIREVAKYSEMLTAKAKLEDELTSLNAKISASKDRVLNYFQRMGVSQVAVKNRMLYLRRNVVTSKKGEVLTGDACAHLEQIGLSDYVGERINVKGLAAWVREKEENGETLTEIATELGDMFNIVELFDIGSRKR